MTAAPALGSASRRPTVDAQRARRRRALVQLAERYGEVRVVVRQGGVSAPHSTDVLELLDELNATSRLRWGGLQRRGDVAEMVYLSPHG